MRFQEKFQTFACEGDAIACISSGFDVTARLVRDDCPDAPDQRSDGFWPSLEIGHPGFIGPGPRHRQCYTAAQSQAEAVMAAWRRDEWFYCGIVLSVSLEGVLLAPDAVSIWGVEANYPGSDNAYLTEVAEELLPEAIAVARTEAKRLADAVAALQPSA